MLWFGYVLDPSGLMESLSRGAFRVAISAGVMEHIPAAIASQFVSARRLAADVRPSRLRCLGGKQLLCRSGQPPNSPPISESQPKEHRLYEPRLGPSEGLMQAHSAQKLTPRADGLSGAERLHDLLRLRSSCREIPSTLLRVPWPEEPV